VFSTRQCRALVGKALTAAVRDADRRLAALGRAGKLRLGATVRVADVPAVATDPCNIEEAVSPTSLILNAYGQGGGPQLQPFDAPARATVQVSVGMSRAIAG
jgi:hypothetical protein